MDVDTPQHRGIKEALRQNMAIGHDHRRVERPDRRVVDEIGDQARVHPPRLAAGEAVLEQRLANPLPRQVIADRLARGKVIDFLDFFLGEHHWPAFNVADCAIVVGAALLMIDLMRGRKG